MIGNNSGIVSQTSSSDSNAHTFQDIRMSHCGSPKTIR